MEPGIQKTRGDGQHVRRVAAPSVQNDDGGRRTVGGYPPGVEPLVVGPVDPQVRAQKAVVGRIALNLPVGRSEPALHESRYRHDGTGHDDQEYEQFPHSRNATALPARISES